MGHGGGKRNWVTGSKGSGMEGVAGGGSGRVPGKHEGGDSFPEIGKSI